MALGEPRKSEPTLAVDVVGRPAHDFVRTDRDTDLLQAAQRVEPILEVDLKSTHERPGGVLPEVVIDRLEQEKVLRIDYAVHAAENNSAGARSGDRASLNRPRLC